ncbi:MAG: thioredoxin-disulfide reductase [Chloroflexi bacterium]|nr:thioredoxin-disulfide reductase [Chloroflexota bacterium]
MPESTKQDHQLVIIGGGPAGLAAGIYASRGKLDTLLLEKAGLGGQIVNAEKVENYPGFPEGISGFDLIERMQQQSNRWGLSVEIAEADSVRREGARFLVETGDGPIRCQAVIVASGSLRGKLGVPGEERLLGRGVSYCATCDGAFFQGEAVAVVGGGNAAASEALALARFARKVYLIHRRNELRATKVVQESLFAETKIEAIWDSVVEEVAGAEKVEKILLKNLKTGKASGLEVGGIFVATGLKPASDFVKGFLETDEQGHIMANESLETCVPGVFVAGDVRHNSARQCITAAGDGATAALAAERYLSERRTR